MDTNLPISQSNKNKFTSSIVGIISIVLAIFGRVFFLSLMTESLYYSIPGKSWFDVMFLYFLVPLILAVVGLVIGIKKRKTGSRLSSILGIIIPLIAIVLTIFFGLAVELSIFAETT